MTKEKAQRLPLMVDRFISLCVVIRCTLRQREWVTAYTCFVGNLTCFLLVTQRRGGGGYRGYTQDTPVGRVFLPSSSNGECPSKAVSLSCNFPSSWNLVVCAAFSVVLLSVTQCTYLLYCGLRAYRVVVRRGE